MHDADLELIRPFSVDQLCYYVMVVSAGSETTDRFGLLSLFTFIVYTLHECC